MNRNSKFSKDLSAHAAGRHPVRSPLARWRRIFIALALALTVASTGQTPPAQAAPAGGTEIRFSMLARKLNGNATICVGDNVPIYVRVMRAEFVGNQGDNVQDLPGVRVEATMSNAGVGNLFPIAINTGYDTNYPNGAPYSFLAGAVGTTTITFKGTINHIWWPAILGLSPLVDRKDFVNAQVVITVEECQYKITTISHFSAQGLKLVATMEGGMKRDADGRFTGTATVTWIGGVNVGARDCSGVVDVASSQAELTGVQDDDQLIVDVVYLAAALTNTINCVGSHTIQTEVTPDPVTVSVPDSGGGKRQTQDLYEPTYYALHGFVVVVVTRVNQH